VLGWMASDVEALKHKSFRRLHARRTRGAAPHHGQDPAHAAAPADPAQHRRQVRDPSRPPADRPGVHAHARRARPVCTGGGGRSGCGPLVLILDISGSMADYSRSLLQFRALREAFGRARRGLLLRHPADPGNRGDGLQAAGRGAGTGRRGPPSTGTAGPGSGTAWTPSSAAGARRGLCRGGIVVICSDGLDRGDPEVLAAAMERLSLLCHRLVWLKPA